MPKSEREETVNGLTSAIFSSMVDDILFDVALDVHHEVSRANAVCSTCGTRCNAIHTPLSLAAAVTQTANGSSRASTPSLEGSQSPSKSEGNMYFPCTICQRQIASSRYALHLSGCIGGRRAARNVPRKQLSENGRSQSPASDIDLTLSDSPSKKMSKSKVTDEADFNLKRKRPVSPQTPHKKQKKGPSKPFGSPVERLKATEDTGVPSTSVTYPSTNSQSKVPSKLRDSTADLLDGSLTSDSGRSTPETGDPSFASSSPTLPKMKQPIPAPNPIVDYNDFDGDETGSSTDSDSSS